MGPRQLNIDRYGKLWTVTRSGHLVSLDPSTNKMTSHQMPSLDAADPFGVAPDDDVVGYTNSSTDKVGMLIPRGNAVTVPPTEIDAPPSKPSDLAGPVQPTEVNSGTVPPEGKTAEAQITQKDDGIYSEALINTSNSTTSTPSSLPLGITPAKSKAQGTFFYAVGVSEAEIDRVGFVRLPVQERIRNPRDDDDRDDGCDCADPWHGWHGHPGNGDDDDDNISNDQDSPTAHETVARGDAAPLAAGAASVNQSMIASPTTLALIAIAEADNPLAQIGIDVYNSAGLLVTQSVPALGIAVAQVALPPAGTYTWRVRNYGTAVNYTPTTIIREPQLPDTLP
jgi:hypothetical protein